MQNVFICGFPPADMESLCGLFREFPVQARSAAECREITGGYLILGWGWPDGEPGYLTKREIGCLALSLVGRGGQVIVIYRFGRCCGRAYHRLRGEFETTMRAFGVSLIRPYPRTQTAADALLADIRNILRSP